MKKISFLLLLIVCPIASFSQTGQQSQISTAMISGKVTGGGSGQPLEYATVTLTDTNSHKPVNGTVTDKKGKFILRNIKPGFYHLEVEYLGYAKIEKKGISIYDATEMKLDDIVLQPKKEMMQSVTVTGKTKVLENKVDRIVYNVDKDITSQGGVATDALKKIPGVTIDIDGNVELLGNASIRFLIDGKPSGLFGNSVADALQSIPNSQIQSIEVITSPSARYDASGTGGIINIILKKSKLQGFNGNVSAAAGTRLENGSFNLGFKKNNIGLNAFFSGNSQLKATTPAGMDRLTTNTGSKTRSRLQQSINNQFNRNSFNTGMGLDWAVSKNDNITASFAIHHMANRNQGLTDQYFTWYDSLGIASPVTSNLRDYSNKFSVNTFDNSIVYKRKFKNDDQTLEIAYDGSYENNNTFYDQSQRYQNNTSSFSGSQSLNPGKENETELSVDYSQPLSKEIILETGLKNIFQSILSDAAVLSLVPNSTNYVKDQQQSYTSAYRRRIYAGYAVLAFPLFKQFLSVKAGLRYEYTVSHASYSNVKEVRVPDYQNLAPSFVIAHEMPGKQLIKFSYAYRLERPDYRDLNPFMNLSDPHNITTGNPNLQPEIGHGWQLGYSRSYESGNNINLLLYTERNFPDIKPYLTYYPTYKIGDSTYSDVTIVTRANIAHEIKTGMNLSFSIAAGKKINFRGNVMIFKRSMENIKAYPAKTSTTGYRLNMNMGCQLSKTFAAELFGNYNSGMQWQGRQPAVFSYTLAVRRQMLKNKASIGLVAVNAFNKYIFQKSQQLADNIVNNSYRNIPYRSFGASFTWKFGKLKFTKQKEGDNYLYGTPPVEN